MTMFFFGLFNPQNQINWLGRVQLLSLNLTWWGATYRESSLTLSINKLKSSRFIRRTPGIIDLNNVNRRSVKIIFPLTGRQNSFWDNLTAETRSVYSSPPSINWVNITFSGIWSCGRKFSSLWRSINLLRGGVSVFSDWAYSKDWGDDDLGADLIRTRTWIIPLKAKHFASINRRSMVKQRC